MKHIDNFQYYQLLLASRYPYQDPGAFASGAIQSEVDKELCVDTLGNSQEKPIGLYACHQFLNKPGANQNFKLSWFRDIRLNNENEECLDSYDISIWSCHFSFGHQFWTYDLVGFTESST